MKKQKGFTLIELLVVISIIALLLAILAPALSKVKMMGYNIACKARLHQLGFCFEMYTNTNDGYFMGHGFAMADQYANATNYRQNRELYFLVMYDCYGGETKVLNCPTQEGAESDAKTQSIIFEKNQLNGANKKANAYAASSDLEKVEARVGYGINNWVTYNPKPVWDTTQYYGSGADGGGWAELSWKKADVPDAETIPVLGGDWWHSARTHASQEPIQYPEEQGHGVNRYVRDRHDGYNMVLYMDWHVDKITMKEPWILNWHREWMNDICDEQLPEWPFWMARIEDPKLPCLK